MPVKKTSKLPVPVKIKRADTSLETIREKMQTLGITEAAVSDAVLWSRKRKSGSRKCIYFSSCYSFKFDTIFIAVVQHNISYPNCNDGFFYRVFNIQTHQIKKRRRTQVHPSALSWCNVWSCNFFDNEIDGIIVNLSFLKFPLQKIKDNYAIISTLPDW